MFVNSRLSNNKSKHEHLQSTNNIHYYIVIPAPRHSPRSSPLQKIHYFAAASSSIPNCWCSPHWNRRCSLMRLSWPAAACGPGHWSRGDPLRWSRPRPPAQTGPYTASLYCRCCARTPAAAPFASHLAHIIRCPCHFRIGNCVGNTPSDPTATTAHIIIIMIIIETKARRVSSSNVTVEQASSCKASLLLAKVDCLLACQPV